MHENKSCLLSLYGLKNVCGPLFPSLHRCMHACLSELRRTRVTMQKLHVQCTLCFHKNVVRMPVSPPIFFSHQSSKRGLGVWWVVVMVVVGGDGDGDGGWWMVMVETLT